MYIILFVDLHTKTVCFFQIYRVLLFCLVPLAFSFISNWRYLTTSCKVIRPEGYLYPATMFGFVYQEGWLIPMDSRTFLKINISPATIHMKPFAIGFLNRWNLSIKCLNPPKSGCVLFDEEISIQNGESKGSQLVGRVAGVQPIASCFTCFTTCSKWPSSSQKSFLRSGFGTTLPTGSHQWTEVLGSVAMALTSHMGHGRCMKMCF